MTAHGIAESNPSRIQALKNKYSIINSRIEEAQKSPSMADFYLMQLKKQRLMIKEELEGIRQKKNSSSS